MLGDFGLCLLNVMNFIIISDGSEKSSTFLESGLDDLPEFGNVVVTQQDTSYYDSINHTTPRSEPNYAWATHLTWDSESANEMQNNPIYTRWVLKNERTYFLCSEMNVTSCPDLGNNWVANDGQYGIIWHGPFHVKWVLPLRTVMHYCTLDNVINCPKPYDGHWRAIEGLTSIKVDKYFEGHWWAKVVNKSPYFCKAKVVSDCLPLPGGCWIRKYRGEFIMTLFKGFKSMIREIKKLRFGKAEVFCIRDCSKITHNGVSYQWSPLLDQEKYIWEQLTNNFANEDWNDGEIIPVNKNDDSSDNIPARCEKKSHHTEDDNLLGSLTDQQGWEGNVNGVSVFCYSYSVRTCEFLYGLNTLTPLKKFKTDELPGMWVTVVGETKLFCSSQERKDCPFLSKEISWRKFQPRITTLHQRWVANSFDGTHLTDEQIADNLEWYDVWKTKSRDGVNILCYAQVISECQEKSGIYNWKDAIQKASDGVMTGKWVKRMGDTTFFCNEPIVDQCFVVPRLTEWRAFSAPVYEKDYSSLIANKTAWESVDGHKLICYSTLIEYCKKWYTVGWERLKNGSSERPIAGEWAVVSNIDDEETIIFCHCPSKIECPKLNRKSSWEKVKIAFPKQSGNDHVMPKYSDEDLRNIQDDNILRSMEHQQRWEANVGGIRVLCYADSIRACRGIFYDLDIFTPVKKLGTGELPGTWIVAKGETKLFCSAKEKVDCPRLGQKQDWLRFKPTPQKGLMKDQFNETDKQIADNLEWYNVWETETKNGVDILCYAHTITECRDKSGTYTWQEVIPKAGGIAIMGRWISRVGSTSFFCNEPQIGNCSSVPGLTEWREFSPDTNDADYLYLIANKQHGNGLIILN
uniref:Vitamin K-dependent protein Z n=1 Tax=Lygus hesperus TaxID=30085 RepID=A0A0A9YEH6_LYGHE